MLWLVEHLEFTDVIDILLLSYILYRILVIMKGTKAIQSIFGMLFLLFLYFASNRLGLYSIHWLLEKFFVYLVLAIIILFQEDIRRGLARAGSIFPRINKEQVLPTQQTLIKVSFALSSRRIGALIAIERTGSLNEFVEPATVLDAVVSQELLTALFLPTSPLHDGAVIIKNNRVAAAQSFLPLSTSKTISKLYGTRHRAAIGLTEKTDAVVIVISEERGTVGVAQNGTITVARDSNEMGQMLQEAFAGVGSQES